mmetsp:Transcript_86487/g.220424  ORF Transcript_86487/g.220424 Transcript_86487/m.220424 type:complete len:302 (-) Transcript_86487:46-951(-)
MKPISRPNASVVGLVLLFSSLLHVAASLLVSSGHVVADTARLRANASRTLLCTFPGREHFSHEIQIYVAGNVRSLVFDSSDEATQTFVKCKGPLPQICMPRPGAGGLLPSCEHLSCVCDRDGSELFSIYTRGMMDQVLPICTHSKSLKVLSVGLGAGALPQFISEHCPKGTSVESVEYDPRVIEAATQFFGFHIQPGVNEVENSEGGAALRARVPRGRRYDIILVDCFSADDDVPASCRDEAFARAAQSILRPGGKVIQHIWAQQLADALKTYKQTFGIDAVTSVPMRWKVNYLIVAEFKQ